MQQRFRIECFIIRHMEYIAEETARASQKTSRKTEQSGGFTALLLQKGNGFVLLLWPSCAGIMKFENYDSLRIKCKNIANILKKLPNGWMPANSMLLFFH